MHARFYAPGAEAPGDSVSLPEDEAEHLTRVLRLKPGDAITVFNGRGGEFRARVEHAGRRSVRVMLEAPSGSAAEPRIPMTLLQAVLKPDNMDAAVRDAVMLGVAAIHPVVATRSETSVASLERARRQSRWTRIAIASAKQCGRATVPVVHAPLPFPDALAGIGRQFPAPALLFAEPALGASATPLHAAGIGRPERATLLTGPEGGWTPEEIATAIPRAHIVTLRLPTIRASAMAAVGLAALYAAWGEL